MSLPPTASGFKRSRSNSLSISAGVFIPESLTLVHRSILTLGNDEALYIELEISRPSKMQPETFEHWFRTFIHSPLFTTMLYSPSDYLDQTFKSWEGPVVLGIAKYKELPPVKADHTISSLHLTNIPK